MKLSIVIPVYNEEKTLLEIIRRVEVVPINKEIIIVDDYSTDSTRNILSKLEGKYRIIYQDKNRGKGAAIRTGFKNASGDIVVVQDADLEYNPQDFIKLIQPIILGKVKVVYGSRFLNKSFRPQYFMAYVGNKFLSFLTSFLYGQKVTDMETCYKMFSRSVIDDIDLVANRFDIEPEITAKFILAGHEIMELPIDYDGRSFEEGKKIGWRDGLTAIATLIKHRLGNTLVKKKNKKLKLSWVIFLYFLTLIVATYPLIINVDTSIPGDGGDSFLFLWNQWWVKYALIDLGQNPYFVNFIAYPFDTNLVFHTLTFFSGLISIPLQLVISPVISFNIIFLGSLVLAGLGMYFLLMDLVKNQLVAIIGGLMFFLNSYVLGEARGHFQYTSVYVIPFFIYFFLKIFSESRVRNAVFASIILAVSLYNEFYYTLGLLAFALIYIVYYFIVERQFYFQKIKSLIIFIVVWLILSSPLIYLSVLTALSGAYPSANLSQVSLYSPDVRSFFMPSQYHTVFSDIVGDYYKALGFHGSMIYLSYSLIFLALVGLILNSFRKNIKVYAFWVTVIFSYILVVLGPYLYMEGFIFSLFDYEFSVPLPYLLPMKVPFISGILVPARFIIFVILALIVLAAFGLRFILSGIKSEVIRVSIALLFFGVFLFENILAPIPISNAEIPSLYYRLAQDKSDYSILELPFALSTNFYTLGNISVSSKLEYYQSIHHKKLINAWISRVPNNYYSFYSQLVGLTYLINPKEPMPHNQISNIQVDALDNFEKLNIKYIIIHPEYYYHVQLRNTIEYLNGLYDMQPNIINNMFVYNVR
ncbi:glycosyltransferase [Patescibacteria group bacterium]|nr:glycosyltransferase [Patescibacteria group bacterium]